MVKRKPLVVVLLTVPFRLAIWIRQHAGKVARSATEVIIQFILSLLMIFKFRDSFIQLAISGIFRVFIFCSFMSGFVYSYILGLQKLWYDEHQILSSLIVIAELVLSAYIIKKGWGVIQPTTKIKLKEVIKQAFKDFASFILTILTICSLVGIIYFKNCPRDADEYYKFIKRVFSLGIINIIELPFITLLLPFPWRLYMYFSKAEDLKRHERIEMIFTYCFDGFIDISCIMMLIVLLITGIQTRIMVNIIKEGKLSKAIILHHFLNLILEDFLNLIILTIKIVLGLIIFCGIVRAKAFYKWICMERNSNESKYSFDDILIHFFDTLLFIPGSILLLLVLMPFYRLKYVNFNFTKVIENSSDYRQFLYELSLQIPEEISDFYHILLRIFNIVYDFFSSPTSKIVIILQNSISIIIHFLLFSISIIFFWRFIPFIRNFRFRDNWREEVRELLKAGIADIYDILPAILPGIVVLITIYRIPLAIRRRKLYKNWVSLNLDIIREILKDFLTLPYVLAKVICPWRLIYVMIQIWKTNNPKEQRKIIKQSGLRGVEDYFTLIFTVILVLSVWRTTEIIYIVVTHIRQVINNVNVTSSLFRKVFRKFCQFWIDAFMLIPIIVIFLLIIEIPSFLQRIYSFYLLYKQKNRTNSLKSLLSLFSAKAVGKEKIDPINKLNKNVFTNVCSFLDLKSLGNVAQANKKFKDLVSFPPIWKDQYEKYWKMHIPANSIVREIAWGDDYKKLAIAGYTKFMEKNKNVILDEKESDYRIGARGIILEECMLSIIGIPHLIALPAKIIVYLLWRVDYNKYFQSPRFSFDVWVSPSFSMTMFYSACKKEMKNDPKTLKSLYQIQENFFFTIICISMLIFDIITSFFCAIDLFLLRVFSFGTAIQLNTIAAQSNFQQLWAIQYLLQLVFTLIIIAMKFAMLVLPWMASYKYTNYTMFGCVFGPSYINIIAYLVLYVNLMTVYRYLGHFPQFRPYLIGYCLIVWTYNVFDFVWALLNSLFMLAKKILIPLIAKGEIILNILIAKVKIVLSSLKVIVDAILKIKDIGKALLSTLTAIVKGTWIIIKGFFTQLTIFLPKGQIFSLYKAILISSGETLKDWGYLGDLIYTPLVLVWIFWPLTIPYIFGNWYLLLPLLPTVVFFLIKGYGIAKNSWEDK